MLLPSWTLLLSIAAPIQLNSGANPFVEHPHWYVNPANQAEIDVSIHSASGATKQVLKELRTLPSAYWIDKKDSKHRGENRARVPHRLLWMFSLRTPNLPSDSLPNLCV